MASQRKSPMDHPVVVTFLILAVLGKYVPSLSFFATLLGEEAELDQNIRFYQRLVSLDQDGATAVVEAALKERPRAEVFDQILVPALSRRSRRRRRGSWRIATWPSSGGSSVRSSTTWKIRKIST